MANIKTDKETLQVKKFTGDDVTPTNTLKQMNKPTLIKKIEELEEHCFQLSSGMSLLLDNLEAIRKRK